VSIAGVAVRFAYIAWQQNAEESTVALPYFATIILLISGEKSDGQFFRAQFAVAAHLSGYTAAAFSENWYLAPFLRS
jgi:hypothetical protein